MHERGGSRVHWNPALESYKDRFGLEPYAPDLVHSLLNGILQSQDIRRRCAPAIYNRERVLAGNADRPVAISTAETRVLHQPRGRNFFLRIERRVARNLQILGGGSRGQRLILLRGEDGILEKRSGAATIIVTRADEHSFSRSDFSHRISSLGQGRLHAPSGEISLKIGVGDVRVAAVLQRIIHLHNDISPALRSIENAGAIAEATGLLAEFVQLSVLEVERHHGINRVRNLLPISPNVLHRSSRHVSGDAAQAFDAGTIVSYYEAHEFVPVFPRASFEHDFVMTVAMIDSGNSDFEREAGPARVGDDEVAAAAEHEQRKIF